MLTEHILFSLALACIFINFFIKSRIAIPSMVFMICVACIIEISDTGDPWFQWAVIILAIASAIQFTVGLLNFSTGRS